MKNISIWLFLFFSNLIYSQSYNSINRTCYENSNGYFSVFSNPGAEEFQIVLNNKQLVGDGNLIIEDSNGRVAHCRVIKILQGINMFSMSNISLATGVYYIRISNSDSSTDVIRHTFN